MTGGDSANSDTAEGPAGGVSNSGKRGKESAKGIVLGIDTWVRSWQAERHDAQTEKPASGGDLP